MLGPTGYQVKSHADKRGSQMPLVYFHLVSLMSAVTRVSPFTFPIYCFEAVPISIQHLYLRMHFPSPSATSTTSTHCPSISTTSFKTQTKQAQTQTHIEYDSRQRKMCCGDQTDYEPSPNSRAVSARAWRATHGPNTYPMTPPQAYDGGRSGGRASVSGGPVVWYANVG